MGVTYQRLLSQGSQSQRPRSGVRARGVGAAAVGGRAAKLRGEAAVTGGGGAGRARRLAWAGLCGRGGSGRRSATAGGGAGAGAGVLGYDSASYARNFDDGAWKAEEGVSWAGPGGAFFPGANIGGAAVDTARL
uniref:Uncharacterized protein n=1 Tax=Zea mays TaxID=4577 RepID=B6U200_MAIZE|nr:hypothetical protein [Zea mays]